MDAEQTGPEEQAEEQAGEQAGHMAEKQAGEQGSGGEATGNEMPGGLNVAGVVISAETFEQILLLVNVLCDPTGEDLDGSDAEEQAAIELSLSDALQTVAGRLVMLNQPEWRPENANRATYRELYEMVTTEANRDHLLWHSVLKGFAVTGKLIAKLRGLSAMRRAFIQTSLPMLTEKVTRFDRLIHCVAAARAAGIGAGRGVKVGPAVADGEGHGNGEGGGASGGEGNDLGAGASSDGAK